MLVSFCRVKPTSSSLAWSTPGLCVSLLSVWPTASRAPSLHLLVRDISYANLNFLEFCVCFSVCVRAWGRLPSQCNLTLLYWLPVQCRRCEFAAAVSDSHTHCELQARRPLCSCLCSDLTKSPYTLSVIDPFSYLSKFLCYSVLQFGLYLWSYCISLTVLKYLCIFYQHNRFCLDESCYIIKAHHSWHDLICKSRSG